MTVHDLVYRYGELRDANDRFSELEGPLTALVAEPPAAFPQRPGALNALLGGANGEVPQQTGAFQVRVQVSAATRQAQHPTAPVLVLLPGGGFLSGTANSRWYTTTELAEAGFVVVAINYRIGALGHLGQAGALAESQRGLRDLLVALRWVREHIATFGGDADAITVVGDSAGAWYGYALATMRETEGLFRRLMLVSMPWDPPLSAAAYAQRREAFTAALGTKNLTEADTSDLLAAQSAVAKAFAGKGAPFLPAATGPLGEDLHDYAKSAARLHVRELALISTPEESAAFLFSLPEVAVLSESVDALIAAKFAQPEAVREWTREKWGDPTPKQRLIEALTLHEFRLAHLELAEAATAAGVAVSLASFSVQSRLSGAYSPHCFILPFLLNGKQQWFDAPMLEQLSAQEVARIAVPLRAWLREFATVGVREPFTPSSPRRLDVTEAGAVLRAIPEASLRAIRQ